MKSSATPDHAPAGEAPQDGGLPGETAVSLHIPVGLALPPDLPRARLLRAARACVRAAQRFAPPATPWREVIIHLTGDTANQAINKRILGHDYPTDVITQAYEPFPFEPPGLTAELHVNVEQARRAAKALRRLTWAQELLLYIAHGCDHLTGADDATPAQRQVMRRRDLRWMRAALKTADRPAPAHSRKPDLSSRGQSCILSARSQRTFP